MALFNSIWDDLKYALRTGNTVTKLMLVNFLVFATVMLVWIGIRLVNHDIVSARATFEDFTHLFATSSNWKTLLTHPWMPFTSMFLHTDFWGHLLGNLIFLALFGRVVADLIGDRRVFPIYLLGGLLGDFFYVVQENIFYPGQEHFALGASAGVMALAGAALLLAPDYEYFFFLLGRIKLKYVVVVLVLLDFVGIASDSNTGGHFAHLGGLVFGWFFVTRLREGHDLAGPVNRFFDRAMGLFSFRAPRKPAPPKHKVKAPMRATFGGAARGSAASDSAPELSFQERLDAILDKIKEFGYENLSDEEKEFLYEASKRN
jgi:membrane associated rhomboid family serine protease